MMSSSQNNKVIDEIRRLTKNSGKIVFVSGNFNIVHPGHLRLLQFAADCGDFLVVGVNTDSSSESMIPADLRLASIKAIGIVGYAFLLDKHPEDFIRGLKPNVVVKGKEFEGQKNPEEQVVNDYGGRLLFGSGEIRFSSLDLLQRELLETDFSSIRKPQDFLARHKFSLADLADIVSRFGKLRVGVVGDLIIDDYVNCEPLGMSQEDPTIVVTPIKRDTFVGGAGIVSAHAAGMGAQVAYFGIVGNDERAGFAEKILKSFGVSTNLIVDDSRPTTYKERYRAGGKTLLRVSHLRQHDISNEHASKLLGQVRKIAKELDLLIFSDFNYGCLPQGLVNALVELCEQNGIAMVADSQASSQISDVSRFKGARLLTPTEIEARLAVRDQNSGLVILAELLRKSARAEHIFITLGSEGLLIYSPEHSAGEFTTDQLPAFNSAPKDVAGAGDSLLTTASMALAAGATVWQSAYLGSIAAACQVSRVGNTPLKAGEILMELRI